MTTPHPTPEEDGAYLRELGKRRERRSTPRRRAPRVAGKATPTAAAGGVDESLLSRIVDGGAFIHDAPSVVPSIWGRGDEVLWAEGEPTIITGPTGVGKTTLGGQVVAGRLGFLPNVLGFPVTPGRRVLYLAMDRPAQIRRALARLLRQYPREELSERLTVWPGPPPVDLARHPTLLRLLAAKADADTVVIDSLKDAAVKLSDEETGQGLARAMNLCVSDGVEVIAYHHQTKRGGDGKGKPNSLADVYGSGWITAGAGSVVLLWGAAGDPLVELGHLKQPAAEVGPLRVVHDHAAGTTTVAEKIDVVALLAAGPMTAPEVAAVMFECADPARAQVEKARRKLNDLVKVGLATKLDGLSRGGANGGSTGVRYAAAPP
jgi:hypothetical protein